MGTFYNQAKIEEYKASDGINQSFLKRILSGMEIFNKDEEQSLYFEESKSLIIGSAVDTLLTAGHAIYNETYIVMDMPKPSDNVKSVINRIFDQLKIEKPEVANHAIMAIDVPDFWIEDACLKEGYLQRMHSDTRISRILTEGGDYFTALTMAEGKTVLSSDEAFIVNKIYESIMNVPEFRFLSIDYVNEHPEEYKDVDIYYQVPVYFIVMSVPCKALLDVVVVNHREKTVKPFDIKTLGDYTKNFVKSMRKYRYDIQGAFYSTGITSILEKYKDYILFPFTFIAESTISPGNPLSFEMSHKLFTIGKFGRKESFVQAIDILNNVETIKFSPIPGYIDAIEEYKWHLENGFSIDREVVQSNRHFSLDWDDIRPIITENLT